MWRPVLAFVLLLQAIAVAFALPAGWSMYLGVGQAPLQDPFYIFPYQNAAGLGLVAAQTNNAGYATASCALGSGANKVVVVFGQSLFTNSTNDTYTVQNPSKVLNFNVFDGNCYQAQYTLLGANGTGGNALARMGDNLVTNDGIANVILVPAMVGATSISLWSNPRTPPYLYNNIAIVARRLTSAGITPTEIVWEQGETDCQNGISQSSYASQLATIIAAMRSQWSTSVPILINDQETWISGTTCPSTIGAAQAAAVDNVSIFAGANTDSIGSSDRQSDNTHFNAGGAAAGASLLEARIVAH